MRSDVSIPASRQQHVTGGLQTHCLFTQCVSYEWSVREKIASHIRAELTNAPGVTEHKCHGMETQPEADAGFQAPSRNM